jgi:hypothetical protein
MNDRSKLIDDSAARHVSGASCFGVLPRNRASTSCFGVVRRRLASESCVGVLLRNDSTRLRHAVTSRGVWGQTAKYVIDKHPGWCFATGHKRVPEVFLRVLVATVDPGEDSNQWCLQKMLELVHFLDDMLDFGPASGFSTETGER